MSHFTKLITETPGKKILHSAVGKVLVPHLPSECADACDIYLKTTAELSSTKDTAKQHELNIQRDAARATISNSLSEALSAYSHVTPIVEPDIRHMHLMNRLLEDLNEPSYLKAR